MKKFLNKILVIGTAGLVLLASCKKDEDKLYQTGGTAPVLTATATDSIPLQAADSTSTAVTFSWTNPNYLFSNGISSLNVTYYLQVDTAGANFTSPYAQSPMSFVSDLSTTLSVSAFNGYLGNTLGLALGQPHSIQVRVESFLAPYTSSSPSATPLYSNVLDYTVTPYAPPPVVTPPASGKLYITGSATADGWMVGGNPASVAGQQFTQVSPTLFNITIPLIGGQQFLLVPVAGDWGNKYATTNASASPTGGSFSYNSANNFNGPVASGTYTVTFNFQNGTYTITP
jgi:starch-binding outer membrane protein SusE/F